MINCVKRVAKHYWRHLVYEAKDLWRVYIRIYDDSPFLFLVIGALKVALLYLIGRAILQVANLVFNLVTNS